jgi:hypothetical protein
MPKQLPANNALMEAAILLTVFLFIISDDSHTMATLPQELVKTKATIPAKEAISIHTSPSQSHI